jgi:hypothetical protein
MLTVGHTKIDAVLTTYRTILAETIDTLAGAQGEVAALTADLAAARVSLEAAQKDIELRDEQLKKLMMPTESELAIVDRIQRSAGRNGE